MTAETFTTTTQTNRDTDTAQHPAPLRHRVRTGALWFGLFGAPAAWSAQLLTAYALSTHTCYPRLVPLALPEIGSARLAALLFTLFTVATGVGVFALFTAVRSWRATSGEAHGDTHDALDIGDGRTRFMAISGTLISTLFLVAILAQGALVLVLQPCTPPITLTTP